MSDFTDIEKNVNERIRGSADMSACEVAYQNGYEKGLADADKRNAPRKPYLIGDGYWDGELVYEEWECPSCGMVYEFDCEGEMDYCPKCGQRILWE